MAPVSVQTWKSVPVTSKGQEPREGFESAVEQPLKKKRRPGARTFLVNRVGQTHSASIRIVFFVFLKSLQKKAVSLSIFLLGMKKKPNRTSKRGRRDRRRYPAGEGEIPETCVINPPFSALTFFSFFFFLFLCLLCPHPPPFLSTPSNHTYKHTRNPPCRLLPPAASIPSRVSPVSVVQEPRASSSS